MCGGVPLRQRCSCPCAGEANARHDAELPRAAALPTKVGFRQLDEGLGHFFGFVSRFSSHLYSGDTYGMTNGLFGRLEVPDVARTGSNITANVDANRKKAFFDHATRANTWLTSARNELARMDAFEKIFRLG